MPSRPPVRIVLRTGNDSSPHWIEYGVVGEVLEVLIPPNSVVVESCLPQGAAATEDVVYLPCGTSFGLCDNVAEVVVIRKLKHPVHVVWHYDEAVVLAAAFPFEYRYLPNDYLCRGGIDEYAPPVGADSRDEVDSAALRITSATKVGAMVPAHC
jgi:hypothetical protein